MGTLCLSQALILRCESLTETESIALFVPTGVEFLFASSLMFRTWGSDRRHLFLTFEGWVYFALALLELLSHIIPAVREDLAVFKAVDIVLGALSSIPLLLYTIFLCFFTCTQFLDGVPQRLRIFTKFMLIILIPVLIVFNEVASFIGITHRVIGTTVAVGFSDSQNKTLWTIFTDFDLGFITIYQALNFSFAFFRLTKAFLEQERIESSDTDVALLLRGTGWVTLGIKLGAVESVIGFVTPQFGVVLARRIIRLLGRASLIIGLLKGLDISEDFQQVREEIIAGKRKRSFRGSRLRPLISDPRLSTFHQLSLGATRTAFNVYRDKDPPARSRLFSSPTPMLPGERVTVHFDAASGQAPTLEMRFSALDMPSPADIVETVKSRPASEWLLTAPSRRSSYYANSTITRHTHKFSMPEMPPPPQGSVDVSKYLAPEPEPEPIVVHNVFAHTRDVSDFSTNSGFRDSINPLNYSVVKDLSSQFPGIPPRVVNASRKAFQDSLHDIPGSANSLSESKDKENSGVGLLANNFFRRKPAPRASLVWAPTSIDPFGDEDAQTGVRLPTPLGTTEHAHQMSIALSTAPTTKDSVFTRPARSSSRPSSYSQFTTPTTGQTEDPFKYDAEKMAMGFRFRARTSVVPSEIPVVQENSERDASGYHDRGKSMETFDLSWLQRPDSGDYNESINSFSEVGTIERAMRRKISRPSSGPGPSHLSGSGPQRRSRFAPRIKSIGKAPRRYTPSPTSSYTRESLYIEPIIIPPRQFGGFPNVEVEQGSLTGGSMLSGITGMSGGPKSNE
ncbi:hypothetical protein J3R30DRAFT_80993 [Lentinula aciculospora]|uniref:Transmembrane protein n=1 Tax=Lentinula aciculospora TaxID=153920 RepID=A0A9W9DY28_9AGAR|nr:hypothetical protein J3R30DRAFT_80993 [Lentinula aciculospora]